MLSPVLADKIISLAEFKKKPIQIMKAAHGEVVAVFSRSRPVFYAVPADLYERILDRLDDMKLEKIIDERQSGKTVSVSSDEL